MKSALLLIIAGLLFAVMALDQPYAAVPLVEEPLTEIVTDCGNPEASVHEAELAAVACPEGYVGQYSRERPAGSQCLWTTTEPQWWACSKEITAQGPALPEGAIDGQTPTP